MIRRLSIKRKIIGIALILIALMTVTALHLVGAGDAGVGPLGRADPELRPGLCGPGAGQCALA